MMALLNDHKGDAGLVVRLQLDARLTDGGQLVLHNNTSVRIRCTVP